MAPQAEVPEAVASMPENFRAVEASGEYRPVAWWDDFEDPVLNELVDGALAANLDIAQAAARAERAAAQARVSRAGLLPSLEASAGASYSDTPLAGGAFSNFPGAPTRLSNETYSLGLAASYELDLFGRVRDDFRAARSDALAAEQDYRSARLATVGEVISAYFDTVDARYQIENTRRTLEVLQDRAARTDERYRRGLAQSFELYQIRQELRGTEANLPQRETALASTEGRLALLLAEYPEGLDDLLAGPLRPRLSFAPVPSGMPADLLTQRPDVAAAWERLEAARLRIGARRAERFPRLSLSASTGTQGGAAGDVVEFGNNWLLQLGANIVAPIIDGGRISANIRTARASYDEAAAAYGQAVLNAWREVELASVEYEQQRTRYSLIHAQLAEAEASADVQAERYQAGVADYTAYLDALRAQYQVESSLSAAGRDVALARLGLHRALGGDWENEGTMR
jgi:NodT family efflux transporter outer membrane factor (OMF) lipoprotein